MTTGDLTLNISDISKVTGNFTAGDVKLKAAGGSTVTFSV
jgi:hypothetical protein